MDIEAPLDGICELREVEVEPGKRREVMRLQIPLVFSQVSTVENPGIWDCTILRVNTSAGFRLAASSRAVIRPYSMENREKRIESRPVPLIPIEDSGANTLLFDFDVHPLNHRPGELDHQEIDVELNLVFGNFASVSLRVAIEPSLQGGVVNVVSMERLEPPGPVLKNLSLLLVPAVLVGGWNIWQNAAVHDQPKLLSPGVVSLFVGAALAFFSLSLSKIRSWVKTLGNLSGVVRFPELHIDSATGRFFSSRTATWLVGLAGAAALSVCGFFWSIELPGLEHPDFRIYDTELEREVDSDRVYLTHALSGRLAIVCSPDSDNLGDLPHLGYISGGLLNASTTECDFAVEFPSYLGAAAAAAEAEHGMATLPVGGFQVPDFHLANAKGILRGEACGLSGSTTPMVGASLEAAGASRGCAVLPRVFHVETRPRLEAQAVEKRLKAFRELRLAGDSKGQLWDHRESRAKEVQVDLQQESGWVAPSDLTAVIGNLLSEIELSDNGQRIREPEQALERAILARGLIGFYRLWPQDRFASEHATALATTFGAHLGTIDPGGPPFEPVRAQWEVLLDVEREDPTLADALHQAIVGKPSTWGRWSAEASLQYLRACLTSGVLRREEGLRARRGFFMHRRQTIELKREIGSFVDIPEYIWEMERLHEPVTREEISSAVYSVFTEVSHSDRVNVVAPVTAGG